jgi:putative spermidine/putrescine transport system substrate-binding protein
MVAKVTSGLSRRGVLAAAVGAAAGSGAITGFPTIWAQNIKDVEIKHAGQPVTVLTQIGDQATKDLGFKVTMQASESADLLNRYLTQSANIDVGDISPPYMKYLVGRNVLQTIPVSKFKNWDATMPLFTKSLFSDGKPAPKQGTAPFTVLYATDASGSKFATEPTEFLNGVPTITNADTLGIRPDLTGRPITSWADLIDPAFKGKSALQDNPTVGVIDVAMAVEARGDVKYGNKGNMTKEEIDKTIALMTDIKKSGQFRSFWGSFDVSAAEGGLSRLGLHARLHEAPVGPETRLRGRIPQLVHIGFRGRRGGARGLLHRAAAEREEIPHPGGVGLLVRRQAGCRGHS